MPPSTINKGGAQLPQPQMQAAPAFSMNQQMDKANAPQPAFSSDPLAAQRLPAPHEAYDIENLKHALESVETSTIPEEQRYTFHKQAGGGMGYDLGRYQVTSGELASYGKKFLGRHVSPSQFLSSPQLQEEYITKKLSFLLDEGVPLRGVIALHSQGMTGWGDRDVVHGKIAKSNETRKSYVDRAHKFYKDNLKEQPIRVIEDLN